MKPLYYGLVTPQQVIDTAALVARIIPGKSKQKTFHLLIETAAVETKLGHYKDPTPNGAGRGLNQVDPDTFDWLQVKYRDTAIAMDILDATGIDIGRVNHDELDYNPLLSMIWCRLRYCAVPTAIPESQAERAAYWKKFYNTVAGKGTVEHYMTSAQLLADVNLESDVWDR